MFRFRAPPELFFEAFAGPSSPRHLFYEDRTFELEQSLGFGEALRYSLAGFVDESLVDVEAVGSILRIGNPDGWELSECFVVEEEGFFAVPVPQQERPGRVRRRRCGAARHVLREPDDRAADVDPSPVGRGVGAVRRVPVGARPVTHGRQWSGSRVSNDAVDSALSAI